MHETNSKGLMCGAQCQDQFAAMIELAHVRLMERLPVHNMIKVKCSYSYGVQIGGCQIRSPAPVTLASVLYSAGGLHAPPLAERVHARLECGKNRSLI